MFLFVSVTMHLASAAHSSPKEKGAHNTTTIQIQQKQIMSKLKDVENKISFSDRRDKNGKILKKERL